MKILFESYAGKQVNKTFDSYNAITNYIARNRKYIKEARIIMEDSDSFTFNITPEQKRKLNSVMDHVVKDILKSRSGKVIMGGKFFIRVEHGQLWYNCGFGVSPSLIPMTDLKKYMENHNMELPSDELLYNYIYKLTRSGGRPTVK